MKLVFYMAIFVVALIGTFTEKPDTRARSLLIVVALFAMSFLLCVDEILETLEKS